MSAARALIALSLSGCVDHMSIGAVDEVDEIDVRDASAPVDARAPTVRDATTVIDTSIVVESDAGMYAEEDAGFVWSDAGLSLRMLAFGRDDVMNLMTTCSGPCIDVEAIPEGGAPPYRYEWWDARTERRRNYCPSEGGPGPWVNPVVRVTDARGESADLPINVFLSGSCEAETEPASWQVCVTPPTPIVPDCPGPQPAGTWFELRQPIEKVTGGVYAAWGSPILFPTRMITAIRARACGEMIVLADRVVGPFDNPVAVQPPTAVHSVLVQFPDEPGGAPPFGISINVGSLCFDAF